MRNRASVSLCQGGWRIDNPNRDLCGERPSRSQPHSHLNHKPAPRRERCSRLKTKSRGSKKSGAFFPRAVARVAFLEVGSLLCAAGSSGCPPPVFAGEGFSSTKLLLRRAGL